MADRDPLRQQAPKFRDLGSGVKLYKLPLLPYERQLIETLGCSEKEYRRFAYLASKRGAARPAEYAHIPDIQGALILGAGAAYLGPTSAALLSGAATGAAAKSATTVVLVNLAVGIALTAASALLAPKPKGLSRGDADRITRRTLGSRVGQTSFSATSGFDTQADLADYASPIPIIFGRWTGATGGILASPQLVWSRAFSLGSQQAVKQMFVVGEQGLGNGIDRPDLNGIFLGNAPLDAIYEHLFAFYWKRNSNSSFRVKADNWAYGTRATPSSGDIEENDDIFLCPTGARIADKGFCAAHSHSVNTTFGVYSAIPNGTNYRVNWRVISIPHLENTADDPDNRLLGERVKIAGDYGFDTGSKIDLDIRAQGQKGTGRNYGRRMGITRLNGQSLEQLSTKPRDVLPVAKFDTAMFSIAPGKLDKNTYFYGSSNGASVDDINSAISASRRAADEYLQIGETVMIGRTTWVVRSRSMPIWLDDDVSRQDILLECIETFETDAVGSASIGMISEKMLHRGIYNDDDGKTATRDGKDMHAGAVFYPLTRVNFGIVRNTRPCEVTEIGIRSQVWNKANGLCNFATLPTPAELTKAERARVQLDAGTMTTFMKRSSVFTIFLRPAGTQDDGTEYEWVPMGASFCVTGETPQDQYNYIRINNPELGQYEFKFVPRSGADIAQHAADDAKFIRLDQKINQTVARSLDTRYGQFQVVAAGEETRADNISFNPEMATDPVVRLGSTQYSIPNNIGVETHLPDVDSVGAKALTVGFVSWLPDGYTEGRRSVTLYELFGRPGFIGNTATAQRTANLGDGRSITLEFNGIVNFEHPDDHPYFENFKEWSIESINVVASTGGFNTQQQFNVNVANPVSSTNPRNTPYSLPSCGMVLSVLSTESTFTVDIKGRESAWEYELFGSAQDYPMGTVRTEEFFVDSSSGGQATIIATGEVTASDATRAANFPGQTQAWDVQYTVDPLGTYGDWQEGALLDNNSVVSAGNPFMSAGTTVGIMLRVLSLQSVDVPAGFSGSRVFESNSQIADISMYGNLLEKSNSSSPEHEITYINESLVNNPVPNYDKMTLCGLVLKSSRNFTSLNQLRVWLADGIPVKQFLPSQSGAIGPSNNFVDLVNHLLTDTTSGAGNVVSAEMIRTEDFAATAQFLDTNKLFFDGAIDSPTNIRQFISDIAPFFLCNFVISDGKFSLVPALLTDAGGNISREPVPIQQLFTAGNIIEGSYNVEYLSSEERKSFQAVIRYRQERRNQLPQEKTLVVRFKDGSSADPVESFDMTQYCTSRSHAFLVAKYFLSLRRRVTHTVKFRTSPYGLSLAPGSFIRVVTEASPYQSANNGTISSDGTIASATELADGTHKILYYQSQATDDQIQSATLTVKDGKAIEENLRNSLFTVTNSATSSSVYMVEQLTLGEDGMVDIVATEFPTNEAFNSLIALDVLSDAAFTTEG